MEEYRFLRWTLLVCVQTHLFQDQNSVWFHPGFFSCHISVPYRGERNPLEVLWRVTVISEEWCKDWAKSTENRRIKLFAWHVHLCVTVCLCVFLVECGVPANKLLFERFLHRSMVNRLHLHIVILIPLFFSRSSTFLYFPTTYSHLSLSLSTRAACYLPMAFCDLWFCSCLSFSSSCLPRNLCLSEFSPKYSSPYFSPSFSIQIFDFGNQGKI